jgi:hypothetical protein
MSRFITITVLESSQQRCLNADWIAFFREDGAPHFRTWIKRIQGGRVLAGCSAKELHVRFPEAVALENSVGDDGGSVTTYVNKAAVLEVTPFVDPKSGCCVYVQTQDGAVEIRLKQPIETVLEKLGIT